MKKEKKSQVKDKGVEGKVVVGDCFQGAKDFTYDEAVASQSQWYLILSKEVTALYNWIKLICPWDRTEQYVFIRTLSKDEKNCWNIKLRVYSNTYVYTVCARTPAFDIHGHNKDFGYLACMKSCRAIEPGEEWTRGRDLADGDYNEKTWFRIVSDIIKSELVGIKYTIPKEFSKK
jgi:hypothetical protein